MRALALLIIILLAAPVAGDVLHLEDGTKLEGQLQRTQDGWAVTDEAGEVTFVTSDQVKAIERRPAAGEPGVAMQRLRSLRRSTQHLPDIDMIIRRYERFIEQHEEAPQVVAEAQKDLAQWQQRLEQGMVRMGDEWVMPEQRRQIQDQVLEAADRAALQIDQGRLREAQPLLEEAVEQDPQSAAAWYLLGVVHYRQDQIVAARRAFERANELHPEHPPTLNNLAVILWRQGHVPGAMNYYYQAMQAGQMQSEILDNVAEAVEALPSNQRGHAMVQRAVRLFIEQDTQLQEQLAREGLYRWGSIWVDQADLDRLREAEREVQARLDELAAESAGIDARIDEIDRELRSSGRSLRRIEASRFIRDREGRIIRLWLPPLWYDIQADIDRLERERAELRARQISLAEAAQQAQQRIPSPRFTGVQRIIGVEGTPLPEEAAPVESAATLAD